jgi:hypothetical protein
MDKGINKNAYRKSLARPNHHNACCPGSQNNPAIKEGQAVYQAARFNGQILLIFGGTGHLVPHYCKYLPVKACLRLAGSQKADGNNILGITP